MKKNSCIFKAIFCIMVVLMFSLPVTAKENIINQLTISNAKDGSGNYELNIDSTQPAQYKTVVEDDRNIYFDLKNTKLSKDISIIYDDVVNIDNLTVKQIEHNKARIYLNGKNVKNTELVFINSLLDVGKDTNKKVVINRPISDYQPIGDNDIKNQDEQDWDDNSFNLSHLMSGIMNYFKDSAVGIVAIFLLIFAVIATIIKNLATKVSQESEPLIGLNSSRDSLQDDIDSNDDDIDVRSETIKQAQEQLAQAHRKYQEYINNKNKRKGITKKYQSPISPITHGIALNQYKKNDKNPYLDQEVITMNTVKQDSFKIPPRPKMQTGVNKKFTSPYIQKPSIKNDSIIDDTIQQTSNMKFLDSVTKIYENSGRSDLAIGLKKTLSKAKNKF